MRAWGNEREYNVDLWPKLYNLVGVLGKANVVMIRKDGFSLVNQKWAVT